MDKFQEMRVFAAVVDAGSFVRASEALDMSKPAVSRYVADLEARLGVRLLQRTTRKLSMTEEGDVFYARCKELLSQVDEAEAEITARSDKASGLLKLSVPVTFGLLHLAPLWAGFLAQNPKVTLDVTLSDRVSDLVEEGFDAAVRIARLDSSSLISRKLSSTRMVLCASPTYLARNGVPQHPSELTQHRTLSYSLLTMGERWVFHGEEGPVAVDIQPCMHTNSGDTCRTSALQHLGLVLQPTFLVGDDLKQGTLVEVLPQYRSIELGIYVVYPSRKHVSPKVRQLVNYLVDAMKSRTWE